MSIPLDSGDSGTLITVPVPLRPSDYGRAGNGSSGDIGHWVRYPCFPLAWGARGGRGECRGRETSFAGTGQVPGPGYAVRLTSGRRAPALPAWLAPLATHTLSPVQNRCRESTVALTV